MKKVLSFLFVVALMCVATTVSAKHVTPDKALQVAYRFVGKSVKADFSQTYIARTVAMPESGMEAFYVVNVGSKDFVIVAADDAARPILGYSRTSSFPTAERGEVALPDNIKAFFDDMAAQVEYAAQHDEEGQRYFASQWQQASGGLLSSILTSDSVGPLLSTTWDQLPYYNDLCPSGTPTGCVATAMAQIINYHQYPATGRGYHEYLSGYGTLSVDYDSATYDYSLMPASLTSSSSAAEKAEVAKLMYHCGVAVNMEYNPSASGAFSQMARAALVDNFGYDATLSLVEKNNFIDNEWLTLLKSDIGQGHPLLYNGQSDSSGGHSFVCDGYNASDFFHFNWGWSGYCNGWFALSALNPGSMGFNSLQCAVVGIQPNTDTAYATVYGKMSGTSRYTVDKPTTLYHIMGNNHYTGTHYMNPCDNVITFNAKDDTTHFVLDVLEIESQELTVYEGDNLSVLLRNLATGNNNDMSPIISLHNALTMIYLGDFDYAGFAVRVSEAGACRAPSNLNAVVDTNTVHLLWTENGTASQWQVEYGPEGFAIGDGNIITVESASADIIGLQAFHPQDFYVRSVCGENNYGLWSGKLTVMPEAKYWDEVVVSRPAGYTVDADGSVTVSTAEGLAWWAKLGANTDIRLDADIDLSAYKWRPVNFSYHRFDGKNHCVRNMYINETTQGVGLFSSCYDVDIRDVGLYDCIVKGNSVVAGCLSGEFINSSAVNCYVSSGSVYGADCIGGMMGRVLGSTVVNCFVDVVVNAGGYAGLLVGSSDALSRYDNNYSMGSIVAPWYACTAGIVGESQTGSISHCYSIDLPMGVVGYKGTTHITDTSSFYKDGYNYFLRTPIFFDGEYETDLLNALNREVENLNDSSMRMWVAGSNGKPVHGSLYGVTCPNVSDVFVRNVECGDQNGVEISWIEDGLSDQWLIKYKLHDNREDSAIIVRARCNPDTLFGIPMGLLYDFSVRSICDSVSHGGWYDYVTTVVDRPYWTDIVMERPDGYTEDSLGNVVVSSAEGLAWLSAVVNGLHGNQADDFSGKTVNVVSDIDLLGYRWKAIGDVSSEWHSFNGIFNGNNHSISNISVIDVGSYLGLFGSVGFGSIFENVVLNGGVVKSLFHGSGEWNAKQSRIGGLIGEMYCGLFVDNCHSSVEVYGMSEVGSLCGGVYNTAVITNCSATGDVYGGESCGGLIGCVYGDVTVDNCYATGNIYEVDGGLELWYRGGLLGNFMMAKTRNCYSAGKVHGREAYVGRVIGCPYINPYVRYIYGLHDDSLLELVGNTAGDISDTSSFFYVGNTWKLMNDITIADSSYDDLVGAMNAWVKEQNDDKFRVWVYDTLNSNQGYPVFGNFYEPSCYNPINLRVSNATVVGDTTIRTRLEWEQMGNPDHWEILYVESERSVDSGTVVIADSNVFVLSGIPIGIPLDFYIRAVCDSNDVSGWSSPVTYIPDKLRWVEVVTSRPEGYSEDEVGNVYISSPEGLAWLISVSNGLNGETYSYGKFSGKSVILLKDLDMSEYRWTPIGNSGQKIFNASEFNGNYFSIAGLYDNEISKCQGLFGFADVVEIKNLTLKDVTVKGVSFVGSFVGFAFGTILINCSANGVVAAVQECGGMVGDGGCTIDNSYFVGDIIIRLDITESGAVGGYSGGLGYRPNSVVNCYTSPSFSGSLNCSGVIAGSGLGSLSHSYGLLNSYNLPLSDGMNSSNVSYFSGSDTTWILSTPPYISGRFYYNLVDALNAWVDENNTDGRYQHWRTDTAYENQGYPMLEKPLCPSATIRTFAQTINACESYTWNGITYYESCDVNDTLQSVNGCDSISSVLIRIAFPSNSFQWQQMCPGDSYTFNGRELTETGWYVDTIIGGSHLGCDSIVELYLEVGIPSSYQWQQICPGESYTFNGMELTEAGLHFDTIPGGSYLGCDSIAAMWIEFFPDASTYTEVHLCPGGSYSFAGQELSTTGIYYDTATAVTGCDSVATLNLTMHQYRSVYDTIAIWEQDLPYILANSNCQFPIVDTPYVVVMSSESTTINVLDHPAGVIYDDGGPSGSYSDNFDGMVTLQTVPGEQIRLSGSYNTENCCDYLQVWDGNGTTGNMLTQDMIRGEGTLDVSTTTGYLTLCFHTDISVTRSGFALFYETFRQQDTTLTDFGDHTIYFNTAYGCDSTINLHLMEPQYHHIDSITVCDNMLPYNYGRRILDHAGEYFVDFGNDSVVLVALTVVYSSTGTDIQTACDSYTWIDGNTYTSSNNTATYTLTNTVGCDSIVRLYLSVNYPVRNEWRQICPGESYTFNGRELTETGDYYDTIPGGSYLGCDSIAAIWIEFFPDASTYTEVHLCPGGSYTFAGQELSTTGIYYDTATAVTGCDSVATLNLTMHQNHSVYDTIAIREQYLPYILTNPNCQFRRNGQN